MEKFWRRTLQGIIFVSFSSCLSFSSLASEPLPAEGNIDALARTYPTPEAIARFLRKGITFASDLDLFGREDYWQVPEEFLKRRRGDCEDYALFAQALLERLGLEAVVLSLYGEGGYAHTVAVFKEKGRYHALNEDRLLRLRSKSLEELASRLYPRWTWGAIAHRSGTRGRPIRLIEKISS